MDDHVAKPIDFAVAFDRRRAVPPPSPDPARAWSASASGAFDRPKLVERLSGDEDLVSELIEIFLIDAPARVRDLVDAAEHSETSRLIGQAHTLKGASGALCADAFSAMAAEIEEAGRQGDPARAFGLARAFASEFAQLALAMRQALEPSLATDRTELLSEQRPGCRGTR